MLRSLNVFWEGLRDELDGRKRERTNSGNNNISGLNNFLNDLNILCITLNNVHLRSMADIPFFE